MKSSTTFAGLLEAFFTDRLMRQRQVSPHTIVSYRETFRQLLRFAQDRLNFNHINHQWLMRMVAHRIADGVLLRLIGKWLRAGVMQKRRRRSHGGGDAARRSAHSPNAKGNFQFDRIVEGWRSRAVLDLRRK